MMILTPSAIKVFLRVMVVIIAVVVRGLVEEVVVGVVGVGGYVVYMTLNTPNTANHNGTLFCADLQAAEELFTLIHFLINILYLSLA